MIRMKKLTACLLAALPLSHVVAQTQEGAPATAVQDRKPDAPQESSPQTVLPNVTVSGQRNPAPSTQSTLSSTGRITGTQIEDQGMKDLREALRTQANVFTAASNNGNTGIAIRGINSEGVGEPGANSRPLTTLVIDGAPQSVEGVRRGQRGAWDVESIEVVRGPQSVLQGRNTLAGSIIVKTNDPSETLEGAARLSAGNLSMQGQAVMLSGPINEEWAFRVAGERMKGDKDIHYSTDYAGFLDDDNYRNARVKLRYKPQAVPGLSFLLTVSNTMDSPAVAAITVRDGSGTSLIDGCPDVLEPQDRYFCVRETAAEQRRNKVRNRVMEVQYELSPGVRWESVTANIETDAQITGAGAYADTVYMRDELRSDRDLTQTLRYVHEPEGAVWSGEAGVFLGQFRNTRDSLVKTGIVVQQDLSSRSRDDSAAVFGELRWRFSPGWRAIGGLRYEEERSKKQVNYRSDGMLDHINYDGSATLPKLGLIREFNDRESLAFSVSTGYRGGFRNVESVSAGQAVEPEFLTSYDLAYRSRWLDGKLTLNANVFNNRWRNQQVSVNRTQIDSGTTGSTGSASPLTTTVNVGRSELSGAEVDWSWRLARRVTLAGSIGLLKTRFVDFPYGSGNLRGNEFPEAPRVSGSLSLQARVGGGWMLAGRVDGRSSAYATSDIFNDEKKRTPGHGVVGLTVGYEAQNWETMLYVDNLFDRAYISGRDFRNGAYVGDPRRVQLSATARF